MSDVSVITLTRYRPIEVRRAIRSVRAQKENYGEHIILIDGDPEIEKSVSEFVYSERIDKCRVHFVPRNSKNVSGPARSSFLRNLGVEMARFPWIAFLDDDNEWMDNHLYSLKKLSEKTNSPAVYSEVSILNTNGEPYLEHRWPWARTKEEAEEQYKKLVEKGVLVCGSNVIHDNPEVNDIPVDTSAWLLKKELLLSIPFQDEFSAEDAEKLISEDDKLFYALKEKGIKLACTKKPTLLYYLGGYSNSFATVSKDEKIEWSNTK